MKTSPRWRNRPGEKAPPAHTPAGETTANYTLVVTDLLHSGGVVVFRGRTEAGESLRCVAVRSVMRAPVEGETWSVEGTWHTHAVHGTQIGLTAAVLVQPSGALFVQAIAHNTRDFPGIGFARAQKLWNAFGSRIFDLLDHGDAATLSSVLDEDLAAVAVAGWRQIGEEAKGYRWLSRHGFPLRLASRVIAIYSGMPVSPGHEEAAAERGRVVWHLEHDPYRMLAFASWRSTEAAARQLGIQEDDDRRLVGAVEASCAYRLAAGDTWHDPPSLRDTVAQRLGLPRSAADRALALATERGAVVRHAGGIQLPGAWAMERFVANRIADMASGRFVPAQRRIEFPLTRDEVDSALDQFDAAQGYPLTQEQRNAVWMATTEPVSTLLGGPGVGKTTVLRAVHAICARSHRTVHQAALSGRAAQRMAEATGRPASTIASLLARMETGALTLDDEPLLVIDESSMVDLGILYRLLARIPSGVRLLLVGDPGQLPPIGFGLVFHVLAVDSSVPRTTLTLPQRQTAASGIPAVCEAIRNGVVPALQSFSPSTAAGVTFLASKTEDMTQAVLDVLASMVDVGGAQVVGSVKNGDGGVMEINRTLQRLRAPGRPQLNGRFFEGDPVIATENDYDLGVMNGEMGQVISNTEDGGLRIRFDSGEKEVPGHHLDKLDLAYAVTTHKAQGSQFKRVVVPIVSSRLLDRTLLLTAVSRAQEQVVIVGDPAVFEQAVRAPSSPSLRLVGLGRQEIATPPHPSDAS